MDFRAFATISGLGAGAIDACINTYVAKYHNSSMMQWLQASFGLGITTGPVIMTLGISLTSSWQNGYLVVSFAIAMLATVFL